MLLFFIIVAAIIGIIHLISMITIDRKIEYTQERFCSEKITADLKGYRIGFITDTHELSEEKLRKVVSELNRREIDLLLLGGDYSSKPGTSEGTIRILSVVNTSDGILGVEGNHDDYMELFPAMEQYGIVPLENNGRCIKPGLYIAGARDWRVGETDIEKAMGAVRPENFTVLVCHNPDAVMYQNTSKAELILCGHTHGGQITFFGIWAPALTLWKRISRHGQRFKSGWTTSRDGSAVYVSRGTGCLHLIPRIFSRPQVVIIELQQER